MNISQDNFRDALEFRRSTIEKIGLMKNEEQDVVKFLKNELRDVEQDIVKFLVENEMTQYFNVNWRRLNHDNDRGRL